MSWLLVKEGSTLIAELVSQCPLPTGEGTTDNSVVVSTLLLVVVAVAVAAVE